MSWLRTFGPWSAVLSLAALAFTSAEIGERDERPAPAEAGVVEPVIAPAAPLLARAEAPRPRAPEPSACPAGMVEVEGLYCPEVEQRCLRWMDPPSSRYAQFRCAEYAPSKCRSREKKRLRFCIDRDEHKSAGEPLPDNHASLVDAQRVCSSEGKRVCRESEWNFACEGEQMRPYPYGFKRDASACNADLTDIVDPEGKLKDLRAPPGAHPRCESPFGVRDMSGNLEEMVARDGAGPLRAAMKGAYWQPSRNHCRAAQTKHDAHYGGIETGFRCCADARY